MRLDEKLFYNFLESLDVDETQSWSVIEGRRWDHHNEISFDLHSDSSGFYWGGQCSRTLISAKSIEACIIQSFETFNTFLRGEGIEQIIEWCYKM